MEFSEAKRGKEGGRARPKGGGEAQVDEERGESCRRSSVKRKAATGKKEERVAARRIPPTPVSKEVDAEHPEPEGLDRVRTKASNHPGG